MYNGIDPVTAEMVEAALLAVATGIRNSKDTVLGGAEILTYDVAGVPTFDKGFVVRYPYGEEFHITIIQTRK
jgi:hypothetical protein